MKTYILKVYGKKIKVELSETQIKNAKLKGLTTKEAAGLVAEAKAEEKYEKECYEEMSEAEREACHGL